MAGRDEARLNAAVGSWLEREAQDDEWYVDALAVFSNWGRKGIGTRLLQSAERQACQHHYPKIALHVAQGNTQALEHVSTLAKQRRRVTAKEQKVGKVKVHAPLGHLTGRWRKHALEGEKITPNYYEAAAFETLKGRLRSGDVAVSGSRRYRPFEHYLLPSAHFEQLAEKQQTRLAVNSDAEVYLTTKQQEITQKLEALQESIGKVEGSLILDEKGHLHLPQLEKAVQEDVERLKKRVYALLPHLPLADLLLEVDAWTGFLRHFTHLTSKDAPIGVQKLELVAALMGMGMNLGLEKMAESCPYTYRQLSWSVDWHIREETLLAALASLDNFVLSAPLSSAWGDGTTSSSDGMRMRVGVNAANAEYNAKYFGVGRGTNMYIHAADIWIPVGRATNHRDERRGLVCRRCTLPS